MRFANSRQKYLALQRLILICVVGLAIAGCASTPERILATYGEPDAIYEVSGSLGRLYPWGAPVEYEWPKRHVLVWYYLERDIAVRIDRGKVVECRPIDPERRESIVKVLAWHGKAP